MQEEEKVVNLLDDETPWRISAAYIGVVRIENWRWRLVECRGNGCWRWMK